MSPTDRVLSNPESTSDLPPGWYARHARHPICSWRRTDEERTHHVLPALLMYVQMLWSSCAALTPISSAASAIASRASS